MGDLKKSMWVKCLFWTSLSGNFGERRRSARHSFFPSRLVQASCGPTLRSHTGSGNIPWSSTLHDTEGRSRLKVVSCHQRGTAEHFTTVTFFYLLVFRQGTQFDTECLVRVEDIEISEETSLYDLKMEISTLPQVSVNVHDVFCMQA